MIFREQDPDVVRWGLHTLIDVCALPRSPSCNSVVVTRYNTDEAEIGYVVEGYSVEPVVTNTVENDAVIALALQEELSRIAAAEASGAHNSAAQASILSQDWVGSEHKSDDCSSKKDDDDDDSSKCKREETDEMLFSFPSPGTGEDESLHSLEIADESLDGEVGKRLYQMVPIPHVPKINGEMPSEDEVVSDHQRLLDRLQLYDLVENKVQGDGNCQFRALSDQLYRSPEYHKVVRDRINFQLKSQPQKYDGYVPMAYGDYLKKMSKNGEWGDHVTLQAAADSYGMKIFVLTSFKDTCYIEILPHTIMSERVIFLSFWAEVHYNSIYPEGELPLYETKKKKKWWMLGT